MSINLNIEAINSKIYLLRMIFMQVFTFVIYFKIINYKERDKVKIIIFLFSIIINAFIITLIKYYLGYLISLIYLIIVQSFLCFKIIKKDFNSSLLITFISLGINYIFYFIAIVGSFIINIIHPIQSDLINLGIIVLIQGILVIYIGKMRRIKNGIAYLNKQERNSYLDILVLNISIIILDSFIIFSNMKKNIEMSKELFIAFIIFSAIMFITIKRSIEAYYKEKLLIQDLNETKIELEDKKKEVEELEAENLSFGKKSHSLAHKQKSLEFKINKLLMNLENAEELGLQDDLNRISKELLENSKLPKLDKTGIAEIDDMLDVMQEECRLNGIDFNLQLNGNIYQMTNNYITKYELSILLADHIKDAIIAINHSDNINKSIMVRLGKVEECFALYIYDSGVEFPKEVLEKLGKEPITTYPDEGGTGMGFMNTFDVLKKYNASLLIESISKPSKDNYTKVIKIKFDNKKQIYV